MSAEKALQIANAHILQMSNHLGMQLPINTKLEYSYTDQAEWADGFPKLLFGCGTRLSI